MRTLMFVLSCLSVCGFYGYVLLRLHREQRRLKAHKKRVPEHLYELKPEHDKSDGASPEDPASLCFGAARLPRAEAQVMSRRETLIQLGFAVGGLGALFAGIMLFNSLVTRLHWN